MVGVGPAFQMERYDGKRISHALALQGFCCEAYAHMHKTEKVQAGYCPHCRTKHHHLTDRSHNQS